ncbi:MAG: energy transducer TonB [Hymenobacteraceae bacterium]|nr:energy transducer TonB [Hymenobacteraceae bacterium]
MPTIYQFLKQGCQWQLVSVLLALVTTPAWAQRRSAVPIALLPANDSSSPARAWPRSTVPELTSLPELAPEPIGTDSLQQRPPEFPGGEAALFHFIRERLRYPALAARNRVEGKVIVSFWLDERGRPYGFGVLKGLGAGLDEEALRILREMPDWAPALIKGQPALLQLRIPVIFRLSN